MVLTALINELSAALRELDRLVFDEEYPHDLGAPCAPERLAALEQHLGQPLPPSYRAFLELHDGWTDFVGDAKLLAVEDHGSDWVKRRLKQLGTLFYDVGENPLKAGAWPVMLGEDARGFVLADPRTTRPDGEMDFVSYDLAHEDKRFPDFTSFLEHKLRILRELIEEETEGVADDP
jgi:hypothetical protein